ncbi:MAG TPA: nucleotidyltransferase domain-containing protein [Candidatus Nanoarchaeia archaeon]|nr:nucleotidyltransferase domain-containing protein [Candidatus Nanoarchaeia archaeon]
MIKPIVHKKYLKLYEETAKAKVSEVLFRYPEKEFSLSDLAREAGVAKANLGGILKAFQEAGLISIEKLSKLWRIKADQTNWLYTRSKIVYNLNFIYQIGVVEFLVDYFKNPKAIILFGSFRKGEDLSNSDVDIAVESDEVNDYKITGLREMLEYEKILGKKIQIHLFNRRNININLFNNIANGILLWGFLEVKK